MSAMAFIRDWKMGIRDSEERVGIAFANPESRFPNPGG